MIDVEKRSGYKPAGAPQTYAFFSVDLCNSTYFKRSIKSPPVWLAVIEHFFSATPRLFWGSWHDHAKFIKNIFTADQGTSEQYSDTLTSWLDEVVNESSNIREELESSPPEIWKTVGDEIIFIRPIHNIGELLFSTIVFTKLLSRNRDYFRNIAIEKIESGGNALTERAKDVKTDDLKIKGSIWLAHAQGKHRKSGINCEDIIILENDLVLGDIVQGSMSEFFGPCIDEGFRIREFSESGLISITMEITLILLKFQKFLDNSFRHSYYVETGGELKGITNDILKYPKVTLFAEPDEYSGINKIYRKPIIDNLRNNYSDLEDYLQKIVIDDDDSPFSPPKIISNGSISFEWPNT